VFETLVDVVLADLWLQLGLSGASEQCQSGKELKWLAGCVIRATRPLPAHGYLQTFRYAGNGESVNEELTWVKPPSFETPITGPAYSPSGAFSCARFPRCVLANHRCLPLLN
jgi:hypothetical protein